MNENKGRDEDKKKKKGKEKKDGKKRETQASPICAPNDQYLGGPALVLNRGADS